MGKREALKLPDHEPQQTVLRAVAELYRWATAHVNTLTLPVVTVCREAHRTTRRKPRMNRSVLLAVAVVSLSRSVFSQTQDGSAPSSQNPGSELRAVDKVKDGFSFNFGHLEEEPISWTAEGWLS